MKRQRVSWSCQYQRIMHNACAACGNSQKWMMDPALPISNEFYRGKFMASSWLWLSIMICSFPPWQSGVYPQFECFVSLIPSPTQIKIHHPKQTIFRAQNWRCWKPTTAQLQILRQYCFLVIFPWIFLVPLSPDCWNPSKASNSRALEYRRGSARWNKMVTCSMIFLILRPLLLVKILSCEFEYCNLFSGTMMVASNVAWLLFY